MEWELQPGSVGVCERACWLEYARAYLSEALLPRAPFDGGRAALARSLFVALAHRALRQPPVHWLPICRLLLVCSEFGTCALGAAQAPPLGDRAMARPAPTSGGGVDAPCWLLEALVEVGALFAEAQAASQGAQEAGKEEAAGEAAGEAAAETTILLCLEQLPPCHLAPQLGGKLHPRVVPLLLVLLKVRPFRSPPLLSTLILALAQTARAEEAAEALRLLASQLAPLRAELRRAWVERLDGRVRHTMPGLMSTLQKMLGPLLKTVIQNGKPSTTLSLVGNGAPAEPNDGARKRRRRAGSLLDGAVV